MMIDTASADSCTCYSGLVAFKYYEDGANGEPAFWGSPYTKTDPNDDETITQKLCIELCQKAKYAGTEDATHFLYAKEGAYAPSISKKELPKPCQCFDANGNKVGESNLELGEGACQQFCQKKSGATQMKYGDNTRKAIYGTQATTDKIVGSVADRFTNAGAGIMRAWTGMWEGLGGLFLGAINGVLYALLGFIALLFGLSATIFSWAVDAQAWSGMFNAPGIYSLWGMIRDFFNLFFILTLLFIAFCTIFQIQAYNYRKWLLNLVLMALLVNFSFPVSRFIVDASNVPMYFFMDTIVGDGNGEAKGVFEAFIGGSELNDLVFPPIKTDSTDGSEWASLEMTKNLIQALVFVFLLASALLVLAILFLIRFVMLLVLVIFSPVGFAGSAIPWLQKFSKDWWDNFLRYAFFGPSAMLVLLVAIEFLEVFRLDGNSTNANLVETYTSTMTTAQNEVSLLTSLAISVVPIVLIWVAIGMGQKMSIAGADVAKKYGMGAMNKVSMLDASKKRWGAFRSERKKRADAKFAANNIGTRFGRATNMVSDKVGTVIGTKTARNAAQDRVENAEQERVKEEATRNRINERMSVNEWKRQLEVARKNPDKAHLAALLQHGRTRDDLKGEIEHSDIESIEAYFKGKGEMKNAVFAETQQQVAEGNLKAAYGEDVGEMTKALKSGKVKMEDQHANALTSNVLQAGLESNKIDQDILDTLNKDGEKGAKISANIGTALDQFESGFAQRMVGKSLEEQKALDKQRTAAHRAYLSHTGDFHARAPTATQNAAFKKADKTTFKNMSDTTMGRYMSQIASNMPIGKTVSIVSGLAEDDTKKARDFITALEMESRRFGPGGQPQSAADAGAAMDRLRDDYRTRKLL